MVILDGVTMMSYIISKSQKITEIPTSPPHLTTRYISILIFLARKFKVLIQAGGYLTVQEAPWRTPLATAFVEAGVEMGFENRDANGEFQTGFMIPQGTIRRGSRCSTAKAFLRPIRHRKNLHIAMHAYVSKILIDPDTKIAYGVRFKRDGINDIC